MALDPVKNFAKVTVSTGYDDVVTSVVLSAGHGLKLPTVPTNVTWWNSTDYPDPTDDPNVEIVTVTAIAADTLTVTRGQESIAATTKNTAGKTYKMVASLTAKVLTTDFPAQFVRAYGGAQTVFGVKSFSAESRFASRVRMAGLQPWIDPTHATYGAYGFSAATTGSITSGTNQLVVASASGYAVGGGIYVVGAGAAGAVLETYVTAIAGTTFTLNDNASTTVVAAVVNTSDTRAIQAALNAATAGGGSLVFLPEGRYNISQLQIPAYTCLMGAGRFATRLYALPGNTLAMITNKAGADYQIEVRDLYINGNRSATPAPVCDGIFFDGTTTTLKYFNIENVMVFDCGGHGVHLKGTIGAFHFTNLWVYYSQKHGWWNESPGISDCVFTACQVEQSGWHGIYEQGWANQWMIPTCGDSGQVDASTYGDNFVFTGQQIQVVGGKSLDALRDGVFLDGCSRCDIQIDCNSNTRYHYNIGTSGSDNKLRGYSMSSDRRTASALLNIPSGSTKLDAEIIYSPLAFTTGAEPVIGAGISGNDHYLVVRNGSLLGAGDINVFECEPLIAVSGWTRNSPSTLFRTPGSTVYRLPG